MNIKYYILIIPIFIISCQNENERIKSFNNTIPKTDKIVLESWVKFYDDLLKDNYQSSNPKKLLNDIINDESSNWKYNKLRLCQLISDFDESTLDIKVEDLKYDTVYIGQSMSTNDPRDTTIITVTQDKDTSEHFEFFYGDNSWEAQLENIKKGGYWRLLNGSSFIKALKSQDNAPYINEYIEAKELFGKWSYKKMAIAMERDSTFQFEDFFVKRVLVFEIICEHMKQKHGC